MAVGHPDYWRRMVSRISIEGYAPEYYFWDGSKGIAGGEQWIMLQYPVEEGYLFNLIGFTVTCLQPGTNQLSIGKEGAEYISLYFDTVLCHEMKAGLFITLKPGDVLRATIVNKMDYAGDFYLSMQGLMEFEG